MRNVIVTVREVYEKGVKLTVPDNLKDYEIISLARDKWEHVAWGNPSSIYEVRDGET